MRARRILWLVAGVCAGLSVGGCSPTESRVMEGMAGNGAVVARTPPILKGFAEGAPELACTGVPGPGLLRTLTPASNGHFLGLRGDGTGADLLGPALERVGSVRWSAEGPLGVIDPVDAWLLAEGRLLVVDGGGARLLERPWRPTSRSMPEAVPPIDLQEGATLVRLPFPPHRALPFGDRILLVSAGAYRESLLHLWAPGEERVVRFGLADPAVEDPRLRLLVSLLEGVSLPSGGVLLAHPLLLPNAYRVAPDGVVDAGALLPLPDGEHARWNGATGALREEEWAALPAPALHLAALPSGEVLVLTRSGGQRAGFREKAILRLDTALAPVGGGRLPVNGILMAVGAGGETVFVMSPDGEWARCELPRGQSVPTEHGGAHPTPPSTLLDAGPLSTHPLHREVTSVHAAIPAPGGWIVLDGLGARWHRFDSLGVRIGGGGRRGSGPGELEFPVDLVLVGDTVVVGERARGALERYHLDGRPMDRITLPAGGCPVGSLRQLEELHGELLLLRECTDPRSGRTFLQVDRFAGGGSLDPLASRTLIARDSGTPYRPGVPILAAGGGVAVFGDAGEGCVAVILPPSRSGEPICHPVPVRFPLEAEERERLEVVAGRMAALGIQTELPEHLPSFDALFPGVGLNGRGVVFRTVLPGEVRALDGTAGAGWTDAGPLPRHTFAGPRSILMAWEEEDGTRIKIRPVR
jgi:hypothetical protein